MFKDSYTGKEHKGVGVTDHQGNKIPSNDIIQLWGRAKTVIVSINDPKVIRDAIYPERYLYTGMDGITPLTAVIDGTRHNFGFTSENINNLVKVINELGKESYCANPEQVLSIENMIEHFPSGCIVHKDVSKHIPVRKYERFKHPKIDPLSYKENMKFGTISPTCLISEGKRYSWGVEIETYEGFIPTYLRSRLNIDCQYDGSILDGNGHKDTGGEYTTGVLIGDNGFTHLYKICYELARRCKINNTCSIHVHIGGVIFNKEYVVLLYKVLEDIENELFSMMPPSRRVREHCRPMKKLNINLKKRGVPYDILIDKYYSIIVKMVSLGQDPGPRINKKLNHPQGRYCNYDRNTPRYWWCNFVPTLFNIKGKDNYTIEIRNHSASFNFTKIKNWVLICMGIVSFVENHQKEILVGSKVSIFDIIRTTYPGKGDYLIKYIKSRIKMFEEPASAALYEVEEYKPANNLNADIPSNIKNIVLM